VAVQILGRGRCEEGAQICWPRSEGGGGAGGGGGQVVGYVTSACARGFGGYPGGVGFCSLAAVWQLHCQQGGRAQRGGGDGGGGGGGSGSGCGWAVKAAVLNPGSGTRRAAQLRVVVDEP
jgi:hypothetical protein